MGSTVIWKISDTLVAKLGGDTTEYSALQYFAQHAPELPVPKPHGLITWHASHLTLMTYIPSTTLRAAWPSLSEGNGLSIREQLGKIVTAWRSIPVEPGVRLGGISGEGVRDFHGWAGDESRQVMTTAQEFSDWQFSYCSHATESCRGLVQRVTPPVGPDEPIVLTHRDLWPANIMVDKDADGLFRVTGIIDWGESGFYPACFEQSKMLHVFGFGSKDDWWRYLPECLAPSTNPQRWLAAHLWHQTCK